MDAEVVKLIEMIDRALSVTGKRQLVASTELSDWLLDMRQQTTLIGASHE